jgi:hypothetical protein
MLATIRDLPNHPLPKQEIARRRELLESVSHRVILGGDFLDGLTLPLRETDYFVLGQASRGRYYSSIDVAVRVLAGDGKPIFTQERTHSQYFDKDKFEELQSKAFAYKVCCRCPQGCTRSCSARPIA